VAPAAAAAAGYSLEAAALRHAVLLRAVHSKGVAPAQPLVLGEGHTQAAGTAQGAVRVHSRAEDEMPHLGEEHRRVVHMDGCV
jgi:hypothetical protein